MICPTCFSDRVVKNGTIHTGKQKYQCQDCIRQFVENPTNKVISDTQWSLVDKLLLEKIPIAGISRVTGISEVWLQKYINKKYQEVPKEVAISSKKRGS